MGMVTQTVIGVVQLKNQHMIVTRINFSPPLSAVCINSGSTFLNPYLLDGVEPWVKKRNPWMALKPLVKIKGVRVYGREFAISM